MHTSETTFGRFVGTTRRKCSSLSSSILLWNYLTWPNGSDENVRLISIRYASCNRLQFFVHFLPLRMFSFRFIFLCLMFLSWPPHQVEQRRQVCVCIIRMALLTSKERTWHNPLTPHQLVRNASVHTHHIGMQSIRIKLLWSCNATAYPISLILLSHFLQCNFFFFWWLMRLLSACATTFLVPFFHHPPASSDRIYSTNSLLTYFIIYAREWDWAYQRTILSVHLLLFTSLPHTHTHSHCVDRPIPFPLP